MEWAPTLEATANEPGNSFHAVSTAAFGELIKQRFLNARCTPLGKSTAERRG